VYTHHKEGETNVTEGNNKRNRIHCQPEWKWRSRICPKAMDWEKSANYPYGKGKLRNSWAHMLSWIKDSVYR
jgi:hypothetical protein